MFNRTIQLNVVKKRNKDSDSENPERVLNDEKIMDMVGEVVTGTARVVLKVAASYIAMDTARKVVVNRLSK